MTLSAWASKWGVPPEAVVELRRQLGTLDDVSNRIQITGGESEAAVQTRIRLEASRIGARLWRNNVGAMRTAEGSFVRYGLANESKPMNDRIKSSDLIGIRPITIAPLHVGMVIGQFVAREVKAGGWTYTGTPREQAQKTYIDLVVSLGGDAAFANREGTL